MPATTTVTLTQALPAAIRDELGISSTDDDSGDVLALSHEDALRLVRLDLARFGSPAQEAKDGTLGRTDDVRVGSAVLDFPSIAAGAAAALTIPVPGAALGDPVAVGAPATLPDGAVPVGFVSAAGTVTVRVENTTAAAVDLASATWKVAVLKP